MLKNLLTMTAEELAEKTRDVSLPEATLYALLGFLMVFVGITFLIFIVWAIGKVMNASKPKEKVLVKEKEPATALSEISVSQDETAVDDETVAVIMAALMAYYQKNNPKCEFTVKRIKRV